MDSSTPHAHAEFRQTPLGVDEFAWIQAEIDGGARRMALAEAACRRFGWERPNGSMPLAAFTVLLARLERHGWVRFPTERTRHPGGGNSRATERLRLLDALGPIPCEYQPEGEFSVRPIAKEERDGFRLHLQRYHYLGFKRSVGESMGYAAFLGRELVGLLDWGAAALRCHPRDQFVGWDDRTRARNLHLVVNNRRFLVLPWIRVPHLASRILGANLRRLSRDWEEAYGHPVLLAETFVDGRRFRGTCYRAANWRSLGMTLGESYTRRDGTRAKGSPKATWVYALARDAPRLLRESSGVA